ncbi:hypothetical protein B566_EDAN005031 [Ephemera danica]|nr:hypothetical protein B566_EDAN005031 [Ephemera danica]
MAQVCTPSQILHGVVPLAGDTEETGTGILAWLADAITQGLLLARDSIAAPLTWITSAASSLLGWIVSMASVGVEMLCRFFSFAISPFTWFFMLFGHNQTEVVRIVEEKHSMEAPAVATAPQTMSSAPKLDVDALALKIMESAMFQQWKDKVAENQKQESDSMSMAMLHEINLLKASLGQSEGAANSGYFQTLLGEIRNLRKQVRLLQFQQRGAIAVKQDCCDKFDDKVLALFAGLYGAGAAMTPAEMSAHIRNKLADLDNLEAKISKLTAAFEASRAEAKTVETSGTAEVFSTSDAHVLAIVNAALAKYDADKTNMVDYALESSGGEILSTRCSENYDHGKGETFYFGLSWFSKEYRPNNPRTIIQPNMHPGECWAFKGATGYAVIKLSTVIKLTAVTMEHIPRSIVPNGSFASAPRDFSVWGLTTLNNPEPLFLGRFRYEDSNQPVQTFQIDVEHDSFRMVELRIESNHGHIEYTCVYRFRIHGVPSWS